MQAALTGHLVLATLHTNSATAAVPRLIEMGVEPYLLSAVLRGSLAQRLVRRLCPHCAAADERLASKRLLDKVGTSTLRKHGRGCDPCGGSGYVGRVAVGELAMQDSRVTEALTKTGSLDAGTIDALGAKGFVPLRQDALQRAAKGEIGIDDIMALLNGND